MTRSLALALSVLVGCSYDGYEAGPSYSSSGADEGALAPVDDDSLADDTAASQCDDAADVTLYISPDDSNSMSSPVQARLAVHNGSSNLAYVALRPWEFFNYYSFAYPPAVADDVAVHLELVQQPGADDAFTMQIAVVSPARSNWERDLVNVTFVLDTSGSMGGEPLGRLKDAGYAVASSLRAGDVVSMVTWSTSNNVVLDSHVAVGPNDPVVMDAFARLSAGGGTDLAGGLRAGYALAEKNRTPDRINRVFLVSDGGANVGVTDADLIAEKAGGQDADGIYMVGVGVGTATSYNDALMDTVTDVGKGASVFLGDPDEAARVFGPDRFVELLDVAARDVQVRLDLPPGFEIERFSGEEYSADPSEIEPQHLAPDDAMVFFQTLRTCVPELVDDDAPIGVTVTWLDAITFEPHEAQVQTTFGALLGQDTVQLRKGAAIYAYTEALRAVKDQRAGAADAVGAALDAVGLAEVENPGDADLAEIRAVLQRL